jgi:homoserine kinase
MHVTVKKKAFRLKLPATSANLGPAFDAAALAFNLFLRIEARAADDFSITARGRDAQICGAIENHLILNTYGDVLKASDKSCRPLALKINNEIPIGKGCGSSASARLAGIALAVHFGKLKWSDTRIIGEAARLEHHPDNVAACWVGGLAVAKMIGESEAAVARIVPKGKWPLLLLVPDHPLSTEEARRVLPGQYSRADAVENLQNAMLLLAAFGQGRPNLLRSALKDRIHQPYRAPLCPLLPAMQSLPESSGILGVCLSGAGPSVLAFVDPKANIVRVKKLAAVHLHGKGLHAELIESAITNRGASAIPRG